MKFARIALMALSTCLLLAAPSGSAVADTLTPKASPSAEDIETAKASMGAGVAFIQDPAGARYEEAYPNFAKAYTLSGSLNALQNLAICAMKLELDGEAISYYETFLEKRGEDIDPADKEQVERDLAALKSSVAWVTLSSDRPGVKLKDERTPRSGSAVRNKYDIGLTNKRLGIHPGSHTFVATAEGFDAQTWTIEIDNGGTYEHEFIFDKNAAFVDPDIKEPGPNPKPNPDPVPDPGDGDSGGSRPVPVYVWIAGGTTLASGAAMGVLMGLASAKKSEYDSDIRGKVPDAEQQTFKEDVETLNLLSDVFIGVTGAAAATTLILFLTRPTVDAEADAGADSSTGMRYGKDWMLAPSVDPSGGGNVMFNANF